jgi:DNA recombination protein RmuC
VENSAVVFALVAVAFIGIVFGFWLRAASVRGEKAQLERRVLELVGELLGVRGELAQAQAESARRAGFESLATERAKIIGQLNAERDGLSAELQAKGDAESRSAARISQLEAELKSERQGLQEKLALLDTAKQALANQFEVLAADILEKKSKSFSEGSKNDLGVLLTPLREQIKEFREKVEKAQSDSNTGVTKLETLIGALGGLNQQLTEEARNLTTALRGSSKAQGDWGEFILRDLLEKTGLREGEQYSFQERFAATEGDEDSKRKVAITDVVVSLPGGRQLIIDSKVSLNAYADSVNAGTDEERRGAVKRHLASVREHIDELASRRYQKLSALETPDFVVMFIPIEPAFLVALQEDEGLWRYAYEKEVLLVGPTTLLFVIRIVDNLWQQELQARGVRDVMNRGAELYDKFVGFVSDLEAVGKSLRGADQSYSSAMKKLSEGRGNLIRQVEMLKELGVRTGKSLPRNLLEAAGVEEQGLALAASEEESGVIE